MIDVEFLRRIYLDKLAATGSFDQAFTKAVWVAYQAGQAEKERELVTKSPTTASTPDSSSDTSG